MLQETSRTLSAIKNVQYVHSTDFKYLAAKKFKHDKILQALKKAGNKRKFKKYLARKRAKKAAKKKQVLNYFLFVFI